MKIGQVNFKEIGIIAVSIAIVVLAIYFGIGYFSKHGVVPEEFTEARRQASFLAYQIVFLTGDSIKSLNRIAEEDKKYNFSKALEIIRDERDNIKEVREKSIKLNKELDGMNQAISGIRPEKARDLAMSAINSEVSLVNHLVNYNAYFSGLLETLKYKFSGDIKYDADDVQVLIRNINNEVQEVNRLNELFSKKMKEFDDLVK